MPEPAARTRLREAREQAAAERESDLDPAELLKSIAIISANLKRHIKEEGLRIGAELGKNHAKAAQDRIRENAVEMQRLQDLVAEFRLQREPLERAADLAHRLAGAIHRAQWGGEETISVKALVGILNAPDTVPEGATISEG